MIHEIRLAHASLAELERDHGENLRKGRAFVVGAAGPSERDRCRLVVVHPTSGATFGLDAEVVWVRAEPPGAGVGVQLLGFGDEARDALARFVTEATSAAASEAPPAPEGDEDSQSSRGAPRNVYERVRSLGLADRATLSRLGSLPERVALERSFGAGVWEALLVNPQITPPEVARIAKNGTLTKPLVQLIVGNAAWLAVPEVQRSLLGNPRVNGAHLERVIRAIPRAELTRLASSSAYRAEVRTLAAKAARAAR